VPLITVGLETPPGLGRQPSITDIAPLVQRIVAGDRALAAR